MDITSAHTHDDPFAGTHVVDQADGLLADIWNWCAIQGCRGICLAGRLFFKKKRSEKFRWVSSLPPHQRDWGCRRGLKEQSEVHCPDWWEFGDLQNQTETRFLSTQAPLPALRRLCMRYPLWI
jgi:hypothetical protein